MPESTIANVKLRPTAFQQIFGWKNKSDILLTEDYKIRSITTQSHG